MKQVRKWTERVHKVNREDYVELLKWAGRVIHSKARSVWTQRASLRDEPILCWIDPDEPGETKYDNDLRFEWKWNGAKQKGRLRLWISGRVFYMEIRRFPGCADQEHEMWEAIGE